MVETVNSVCDFLASRDWQSEVIVVDDGSIDATAQRVQAACETQPNLRLVTAQVNRGKGAAIRLGAGQARGDIIGFIDADDKTDIAGLDRVFTCLADGAHVVIGDRTLADTAIHIQRRALLNLKQLGAPFPLKNIPHKPDRIMLQSVLYW